MSSSSPSVKTTDNADELTVLIPVFNDWEAVSLLLRGLDEVLAEQGWTARVLLVDDASSLAPPSHWEGAAPRALCSIEILSLRLNLGHQRAIAIGLAWLNENRDPEAVVVMDGDGEDAPRDMLRLVRAMRECGSDRVIFAERTKRLEAAGFRLGYWLYCRLHLLFTGIRVRVGNFSVIPRRLLRRIVSVSELWNHYAAAVFRSRIPYTSIPTERAKRLAGRSKMNWTTLVIHGLSALAVHGEIIGVRVVFATIGLSVVVGLSALGIAGLTAAGRFEAPAWTLPALGFTALLLAQILGFASLLILLILQRRAQANFLPTRDFGDFVDRLESLYSERDGVGGATRHLTAEDMASHARTIPVP